MRPIYFLLSHMENFSDTKNHNFQDQYAGVELSSIPVLSDRLHSAYVRSLKNEKLRHSYISIYGVVFMVQALEYHFGNFEFLNNRISAPDAENLLDSGRQRLISEAKFEAISYINTVGWINKWLHAHDQSALKCKEIAESFRNKFTAHRTVDDPRKGETKEERLLHSLAFTGTSWNKSGDIVFQIQKKPGDTAQLDISNDHDIICKEILDGFGAVLK